MKKILEYKTVSLICHVLLAIAVLPFVLLFDKNDSLLYINGKNSPAGDVFFYHITRLPELAMIVFVIVLAFFQERRIFLAVAVAMSLCGLSIILFKHVLFADFHRPFFWLSGNHISFHRVDGIRLHTNGSFPSGHSIAAFSSLALAGFISRNGAIQFLLFILACLSAYSRVYAAQHYLRDVYAGALVGFSIALFVYVLFNTIFKTPAWKKPVYKKQK